MKNYLLSSLFAFLCLNLVFAHPNVPKIGILYNARNHDAKTIRNHIDSIINFSESNKIEIEIEAFGIEQDDTTAFKKLLFLKNENLKILIGPSDYTSLKNIDNYIGTQNRKQLKLPYFICPALDTPTTVFKNIDFLSTSLTITESLKTSHSKSNKSKVNMVWKDLIDPYNVDEIAVFYENSDSGLDIFRQFDRPKLNLSVTGKPFPVYDPGEYLFQSVCKFVDNIADKDIKFVVLAPKKDEMISEFLKCLNKYNIGHITSYRPMLLFFNDYKLDSGNYHLIKNFKIFEISEPRYTQQSGLSPDLAKIIDAFNLSLEILQRGKIEPKSIENEIENFFNGTQTLNIQESQLYSRLFKNPIANNSGSDIELKLFTWSYKNENLDRNEFSGFKNDKVGRFWQTHIVPFWNFQNFPGNPLILFVFVLITFASFTVFMNSEYYIPYKTLFRINSFWFWFVAYSVVTVATISVFLYYGHIKSTQLVVIMTAGLGCPLIMNYIFKQASSINIPIVSSQILDFISRLKENIDLAFQKFIPGDNFDKLIRHIDQKSSFTKVRMSVYSLIVGMRSNALTKKFSSDLKQIMDDVEVMLSQQEVQDGKMKEHLRKHQLIRFYIQILYFTSKNESAFRKRLFESGLGVASVMSKIVQSNTE